MLDARLTLAAALYQSCALGADIGTDHGLLPCHLLRSGICKRMILADVSPKALRHAEENVHRHHLEDRVQIRLADGLDALDQPCGCVSMMGMGGETIREVLLRGQNRLCGAVLVLSSHTEQPLVRKTLPEIGYCITQERLCQAAGRFYIFWRAEPVQPGVSADSWSAEELRYGRLLWTQNDPALLRSYCDFRVKVMTDRLDGLAFATGDVATLREEVQRDADFYHNRCAKISHGEVFSC